MFSSFFPSLITLKFGFGRSSTSGPPISLPPIPIHDTEASDPTTTTSSSSSDPKRLRRLKHLLKLNHANHAILFHHRQFHNHLPHILGSGYILGGTAEHLNSIYDSEARSGLVPWEDSPGEVSRDDWREFLGKREYERGFVDFFEDEVVRSGYDWKRVVAEYLFEGKEPLIHNVVMAGLGHPIIHLGYAFELNSREVAMEALGLAATNYSYLHRYLDDPSYSKREPKYQTSNPFEVLARVNGDERLDGVFEEPGGSNMDDLFGRYEGVVLEHWNAWKVGTEEPKRQFEMCQQVAVGLLISAAARQEKQQEHSSLSSKANEGKGGRKQKYDFFLLHLLTTTHAIRILLPSIPPRHHIPLLRQWFLLTIALYISQLRPLISIKEDILDYDIQAKDWDWVVQQALKGKHALDAHYVKGIRAMKVAAETWGDDEENEKGMQRFYLKAAVRFAAEFDGWGGFSAAEEQEEEEKETSRKGQKR